MKVERNVYIIVSIDHPIEFDDGRGNPVDDIKDAHMYTSYIDAQSNLDQYDDDIRDKYMISEGKVIFSI